jgi:hypothetical protein
MKRGFLTVFAITAVLFQLTHDSGRAQGGIAGGDENSLYGHRLGRRILIDAITADMLPRASFDFDIRTFPDGGVLSSVNVGILNRITIGLSYGASRFLSEKNPEWNDHMEFLIKYRILTEDYLFPSIAFGYSSQGSGYWDDEHERYAQKSKGIFLVGTKSYLVYNLPATFTVGLNVSMEERDVDKDPTLYCGAVMPINRELYFIGEYDLALNDNRRHAQYGKGRGYLNFGLEWVLTQSISLEFDLRNLLLNREDSKAIDREVRLLYMEYL